MSLSAPPQSTPSAGRPADFPCCPYRALSGYLPESVVAGIIQTTGTTHAWRRWPMELVLWGTVLQALSPGRSQAACVQVLAQVSGLALGAHSGGFCKARQRLDPRVPQLAAQWVARSAAGPGPRREAAHGRRVLQFDGTGCSLSDTAANQAAYPQPVGQQPGCGFPQLRCVVARDAATGCLVEVVFGNLNDHDAKLARPLWDRLAPGDIVVADRGFASYGFCWGLTRRGAGLVVRQHQRRQLPHDLVGELDELTVAWSLPRPAQRGEFWDDDLPATLTVRVVRYRLADGTVVVLNTNLGPEFSAADVRDLYEGRWDEEVSFRDVKRTLGLEPLAAATPQLAQTLVWSHVLAYNLVRATLCQAALEQQVPVERLSVRHALNVLELSLWANAQPAESLRITVLKQVGAYRTPDRRGRPGQARRVKRRHGKYPLLNRPRVEYPARERPA